MMFSGLRADLATRLPHYRSDFTDAWDRKVASSALYLFFACLANAIAFGALSALLTDGQIGIIEMMLATAAGGILYALLSAQPITLLGGTGPILIFTALLYAACRDLGLPFLTVYAWTGIWAGAMLGLMAAFDVSNLMRFFSRFTDDVFAALVAVLFIVEAADELIEEIEAPGITATGGAFIMFLAAGTIAVAMTFRILRYLGDRPFGGSRALGDFAPSIAVVAMTALALWIGSDAVRGPEVPASGTATSTGRAWAIDLFAVPAWVIAASIVPAAFASILLFLDQNITSRIINESDAPLVKGHGYHLDLALIAAFTLVFSVFGLPWIVAATVHSVNHLKSLTVEGHAAHHPDTAVVENRVSALVIHVAMALSLAALAWVARIPLPVLLGLFVWMGVMALWGNAFFLRVLGAVFPGLLRYSPPGDRAVSRAARNAYTAVQAGCFAVLWLVKSSALGILFPVFIALCVPVRLALGRLFDDHELARLDDYGQDHPGPG